MKKIFPYFMGIIIFFTACESGTHSLEQKTNETTVSLNEPGKDRLKKDTVTHPDIAELYPGKDTLQLNLEMLADQRVNISVDV